MPNLLLICLLLAKLLLHSHVTHCAPKIGGLLFDPILFEAYEFQDNATHRAGNQTSVYLGNRSGSAEKSTSILKLNISIKEPRRVVSLVTKPTNRTIFISEIQVQTNNDTMNTTTVNPSMPPVITSITTANVVTHPDSSRSEIETPIIKINTENDSSPGIKKMFLYKTVSEKSLRKETILRDMNFVNKTSSVQHSGYNFDDTICRIVHDRVLCGYNLNSQSPKRVETVELANGCRLRGNRIECGYVHPPFANIRRTINKFDDMKRVEDSQNMYTRENRVTTTGSSSTRNETVIVTGASKYINTVDVTVIASTETKSVTEVEVSNLSAHIEKVSNPTDTKNSVTKATTTKTNSAEVKTTNQQHCVEKGDRIICYNVHVNTGRRL